MKIVEELKFHLMAELNFMPEDEFLNEEELKEYLEQEAQDFLENKFGTDDVIYIMSDEDLEDVLNVLEEIKNGIWNTR